MKYLLIVLFAVIVSTLMFSPRASAEKYEYFTFDIGVGQCNAAGLIEMCDRHLMVWHLSAKAKYPVNEYLHTYIQGHHFSSFDGKDDLNGNQVKQTGKFEAYDIGLSFSLAF